MSHPRHAEPLPLGSSQHPYSKGLMARALVAVGVPIGRAYELAKRIEQDLAEHGEESVELERFEELAVEVLGAEDGSRAVDRLNAFVGRWVIWLILGSTVISGINAAVRKAFNYSSNSFLEIQWYLFSMIFLFLAGYTLKNNEHVRIDIITGRFSARARAKSRSSQAVSA